MNFIHFYWTTQSPLLSSTNLSFPEFCQFFMQFFYFPFSLFSFSPITSYKQSFLEASFLCFSFGAPTIIMVVARTSTSTIWHSQTALQLLLTNLKYLIPALPIATIAAWQIMAIHIQARLPWTSLLQNSSKWTTTLPHSLISIPPSVAWKTKSRHHSATCFRLGSAHETAARWLRKVHAILPTIICVRLWMWEFK